MKRLRYVLAVLVAASCASEDEAPPVAPEDGSLDAGVDASIPCGPSGVSKGPWSLAMTETSMVLRWESCRAGTSVGIAYQPEAGGALAHADAAEKVVMTTVTRDALLNPSIPPDLAGTWWMHEVTLTGLAPGKCYSYTLDADATAKGRFCTARPAGEPFRFMAIGDTHPELLDNTTRIFSHVMPKLPEFSVHMGDIQYYSGGLGTWTSWFPLMAPQLRGGAMLAAIGNHESEKEEEYDEYTRRFFAGSGFAGTDEYYRFTTGGVWFFTVDTESPTNPQSPQGKWLAAQLADASSKPGYRFSVLYVHRPFLTCGNTSDAEDELNAWAPTFDQYGLKLILQGHMHGYERFVYGKRTVITTAGGGGLIVGSNMNADRPYCGNDGGTGSTGTRASWGPWYHGMIFDVSAGKLHGEAIDVDGKVVDSFDDVVP